MYAIYTPTLKSNHLNICTHSDADTHQQTMHKESYTHQVYELSDHVWCPLGMNHLLCEFHAPRTWTHLYIR